MAKVYSEESKVGLEKNNGERLTEPLFDKIEPMYEGAPLYVGYIGRHPYIIREDDGIVVDVFQMKDIDGKNAGEEIMNWVLPGLQLFYRDTDTPINIQESFHVGDH